MHHRSRILLTVAVALVFVTVAIGCGDDPMIAKPTLDASTEGNSPPVASAVAAQAVTQGAKVALDGTSSSDPEGDALTFRWSLTALPSGSAAVISEATAAMPTFVADAVGNYTVTLVVADSVNESAPDTVIIIGVPPDPSVVAPPLDPTVASDIASSTSFLYAGSNPIQTGVAPGTIVPARVAVLRGRVVTRDGEPLPGVTVSVLDHAEFGRTLTRIDGMFDLAVNGGGQLTIDYEKVGLLPAQRHVAAPWRDYEIVPDVALVPIDDQVTAVDLGASVPIQVARGSLVTDDAGSRQATLFFAKGTSATMKLPDGSLAPLATLHVRATEYTVGPGGPAAMPAPLPANTGYTYALELSADEAIDAGASEVQFSTPVFLYVDNFIGFPTGEVVPFGYYDRSRGIWIASPNGRVVRILDIASGAANVDSDGDDLADDLGMSLDERKQLALLYAKGVTLWRIPVFHFSPQDANWPIGPPLDARPPGLPPIQPSPSPSPPPSQSDEDPCEEGSIIGCISQSLGETIEISGTPFRLHYLSSRTRGYEAARTLTIPITDGAPLSSLLKEIRLEVHIAGRSFAWGFDAMPNRKHVFVWDGKDAYGRDVQGARAASIRLSYIYKPSYTRAAASEASFGRFTSQGGEILDGRDGAAYAMTQAWNATLGFMEAKPQGLGGWSIDVQHLFDPTSQTVYSGSGARRGAQSVPNIITTVAGNGTLSGGDGGPAVLAGLAPRSLALASDGSLYVADLGKVRRIGPDGIITTVAGTGGPGSTGDGGLAIDATFGSIGDIALGPDGSLYISEMDGRHVRRVSPAGIISTVAGSGNSGFSGDGGPATEAEFRTLVGLAVARDGTLLIADHVNNRVRAVGPDGIITTIAGNGEWGSSGDGGPSILASLAGPACLAVGQDGAILVSEFAGGRVRRIGPDGIISTVAGNGPSGIHTDGVHATNARLAQPYGIALGSDGSIFIAEERGLRVRWVQPDGMITTIAGNGTEGFGGDNGPATRAALGRPSDVTLAPDGSLYIADFVSTGGSPSVRRVASPLPGFTVSDSAIPAKDGGELYKFNSAGRHVETIHPLTGETLLRLDYDSYGRLATIADASGNVTTLLRDAAGDPTGILAPGGQMTSLGLDTNGYLSLIANPAGETNAFTYSALGLMLTKTDPNGGVYRFTYDASGLLTLDEDPAGGFRALTRTSTPSGSSVAVTTALARTTLHDIEFLAGGVVRRRNVGPSGAQDMTVSRNDGSLTFTDSDGRVATLEVGPDPRWGMLVPIPTSLTVATPGGVTRTETLSRSVVSAEPMDPLSIQTLQDLYTLNGKTSTHTYDAAARTFTQTTPGGRTTVSLVDEQGRVIRLTPAPGVEPIETAYDELGRIVRVTQGTQFWSYEYDARNRATSRTDATGREVSWGYDDADRLVSTTLPGGSVEGYSYDAAGNMVAVIAPSGAAHDLTYTAVDLLESYTPPSGASLSREYDLDRALTRVTLPGGRVVNNTFDTTGRDTGAQYPEATVDFTYLGAGERPSTVTLTQEGGIAETVAFDYDAFLVTGISLNGAADGRFAFDYDSDFSLAAITLTSGSTSVQTSIARDADGLITSYGSFDFARRGPGGAVSQITDPALTTTFVYDDLARIRERSHDVLGVEIYRLELTRDSLGRISHKLESLMGATHAYVYAYDVEGHLAEVQRDGVSAEHYTYDVNGNRLTSLSSASTFDTQDRMNTHGGVPYHFDADGFLVERGNDTFEYGARGELWRVTIAGGDIITYSYDGFGRRVRRSDAAGTTRFLYGDPGNPFLLTATIGTDAMVTTYVYDDEGILIAIDRTGVRYFVAADQVGTPRIVTDALGEPVKITEYTSFGVRVSDTNPSFELSVGFAGGLEDAAGLVRFGHRDYEPATGRWTARDPILFQGGQTNLYVYAGSDPVNLRDPSGLFCVGASAYKGLGAGVEVCYEDGEGSVCGEAGIGIGGSFGVGGGGAKEDGAAVTAAANASCGPLQVGTEVKLIDDKGCTSLVPRGLKAKLKVSSGTKNPLSKLVGKCGLSAKIAARICKKF